MEYPSPAPQAPLRCPWWPTCEAVIAPLPHLVRPGSAEFVWVYPIHDVEGPASWWGRCPASQFQINFTPDGGYTLSEYAQRWLADRGLVYTREIVKRLIRKARDTGKDPDPTPGVDQIIAWMAGGDDAFRRGRVPLPSKVYPERPRDEHFPGRPADAPEPGAGDPPTAAVPAGVAGDHFTGRQAMDSSHHSTAKGLAELAVNQMDVTLGLLARITNAIDEAEGVTVAAEYQIGSVAGLVTAAVGTGANAPRSAEQMAEQVALGKSTIGDQSDGILPALRLARTRIETAQRQVAAAKEHGYAYIRSLSL